MHFAAESRLRLKTGAEDLASGPCSGFLKPLEPFDPRLDRMQSFVPSGFARMVGPGPSCRAIDAEVLRNVNLKASLVLQS
eukprot:12220630-Heterocapsa_arctica.AAC.1